MPSRVRTDSTAEFQRHLTLGLVAAVLVLILAPRTPADWPGNLTPLLHHLALISLLYLLARWYFPRALAFSAALGLTLLPLLWSDGTLGTLTRTLTGPISLLTALTAVSLAVGDYRWRLAPTGLLPGWLWWTGLGCALVALYPWFGAQALPPWFLGENAAWLTRLCAFGVLLAMATGFRLAALLLILVSLGYEARILPSHNAWQYLADPGWILLLGLSRIQRRAD